MTMLRHVPPMGIYETLYAFRDAFGKYMGEPGTHPWSQGFPRTVQLPGGPAIPSSVQVSSDHLKYPKAWGLPALREAIAAYYRRHYGADITSDNVMIFAGEGPVSRRSCSSSKPASGSGSPPPSTRRISTCFDSWTVPTTRSRAGRRTDSRRRSPNSSGAIPQRAHLLLLSNPCNPTGVTRHGAELEEIVTAARDGKIGLLVDEAYELFHDEPVSAMKYVRRIDDTDIFVSGAATKGLQSPGIRIGWVVTSRRNVEILGNFSSFGMGGVSHPSQCFALELFGEERIALGRRAVPAYYGSQRERYGKAFQELGLELFTGNGGFYHWCRLPGGMTAETLNRRLFKEGAAILKGTDCDMLRRGDASPLATFFRFSFGPLAPSRSSPTWRFSSGPLNSPRSHVQGSTSVKGSGILSVVMHPIE